MSLEGDTGSDAAIVSAQLGRPPRTPWQVSVRCIHGYPMVIASPPRLDDGTPFPTTYWLSCPYLSSAASAEESAGATARWTAAIAADASLSDSLSRADQLLRAARAEMSDGADPFAGVGIAGQADPLAVKCIHAHVALQLVGISDPVGAAVVATSGDRCPDVRCRGLLAAEEES